MVGDVEADLIGEAVDRALEGAVNARPARRLLPAAHPGGVSDQAQRSPSRRREEKCLPLPLLVRSRRSSAERISASKSSPSSGKTAKPIEAWGVGARRPPARGSRSPPPAHRPSARRPRRGSRVRSRRTRRRRSAPAVSVERSIACARSAPRAQDRVADLVAVVVVDRLEVVEVEDQQRQRLRRRRRGGRPRGVAALPARGAGRRRRRGGWRPRSAGRGWRSHAGAPRPRPGGCLRPTITQVTARKPATRAR